MTLPPSSQVDEERSPTARSAARGPGASSIRQLGQLLTEDLATYEGIWSQPGFLAVAAHRLGRYSQGHAGAVGGLLSAAHRVGANAIDWLWGINIPLRVDLGRRVRIWHHGCVYLNARSIGDDVHLRHNTTFGPLLSKDSNNLERLPTIEDGVDLGSGACVMGPVRVGKGAVVGANTVVLKAVPDRTTILGVPGRVIPS